MDLFGRLNKLYQEFIPLTCSKHPKSDSKNQIPNK